MERFCFFFSNFAINIVFSAMNRITVKDKSYKIMMSEETILAEIDKVAERINKDMEGKNPLFLAVLNGSFMFASDLMKRITIPCEISFVKLSSYQGTLTTGKVKEVIGINEDLTDRHIIIVEDIVESGLTMKQMMESLGTRNPASVEICSLFVKPHRLQVPLDIKYGVMEIGDAFILGYGLDYDQQGRNLKDLYVVAED